MSIFFLHNVFREIAEFARLCRMRLAIQAFLAIVGDLIRTQLFDLDEGSRTHEDGSAECAMAWLTPRFVFQRLFCVE